MRKTTGTLLATLLLAATGGSALSAEVTVMISGGFKAALEKLAPAWEKQTGNHLVVIPGPSMGKTPQAIPNRLARGEHADVVIMVGDALTSLEKAGRTQPDSRRELADSPIGVVVKAGAPLPAIHNADQLRSADHPQEGKALLTYLASPAAQETIHATGMRSVAAAAPVSQKDTVQ